jgi:hypothetical protein
VNLPQAKAEIQDSIYILPAELKVKRSKDDLPIRLMWDTLTRDYLVKSSPSGAFVFGNLLWMQLAPAGYLIDLTNTKRFYYGKFIMLNYKDTSHILRPPVSDYFYKYYSKTYPVHKGQLDLILSFPWVNSFCLHPEEETYKINTGFWGISMGLDYHYKDNRYLALSGNAVMDFFLPIPAAVDFSGEQEFMNSTWISLTDNFRYRRFSLGYGISYSTNYWRLSYFDWGDPPPPSRNPVTKRNQAVGFSFSWYHQIQKNYYLGLVYRPSFLVIRPVSGLRYEHVLSLDCGFRLPINP